MCLVIIGELPGESMERFSMHKAKPVTYPLANHFKMSLQHYTLIVKDKEEMKMVSYASVLGNLMYAMICTSSDIGVRSRIISNPGRSTG